MKRKKIDNSITELSIFKDETSCTEACSAHTVVCVCNINEKMKSEKL